MSVFDMDERNSDTSGLLGGLVARLRGGRLLSRYSQPDPPADVARLAWRGLQALAPHITNPATYAPLPPPSWTPTPEGKLPSADRDPRVEGVMSDIVNIGIALAPVPGAGPAVGAARWLPGLMRRGVPTAEALASKSPAMYNPPLKALRPFEADYPRGTPTDAGGQLPTTSKDDRSPPNTWSVEEWWAEKTKPSRQRNLTPLQRQQRAELLRLFRRAKWDKTLVLLR